MPKLLNPSALSWNETAERWQHQAVWSVEKYGDCSKGLHQKPFIISPVTKMKMCSTGRIY